MSDRERLIRERLIEILKVPIHPKVGADPAEVVADYLIANGVTVQDGKDANVPTKWIPVKDRLPEIGEIVLAFGKRHATSGQFRGTASNPCRWLWRGNMYKDVTHWMPLPQPPKGE